MDLLVEQRLKREQRLNNPHQYRNVFGSSLRFADSNFLIIAIRNDLEVARLGLAVSKKRVNRAVHRNLVKRIIRESFRKNSQSLAGWDVVVVTHRNKQTIDKESMGITLEKNWRRLGKWKQS